MGAGKRQITKHLQPSVVTESSWQLAPGSPSYGWQWVTDNQRKRWLWLCHDPAIFGKDVQPEQRVRLGEQQFALLQHIVEKFQTVKEKDFQYPQMMTLDGEQFQWTITGAYADPQLSIQVVSPRTDVVRWAAGFSRQQAQTWMDEMLRLQPEIPEDPLVRPPNHQDTLANVLRPRQRAA